MRACAFGLVCLRLSSCAASTRMTRRMLACQYVELDIPQMLRMPLMRRITTDCARHNLGMTSTATRNNPDEQRRSAASPTSHASFAHEDVVCETQHIVCRLVTVDNRTLASTPWPSKCPSALAMHDWARPFASTTPRPPHWFFCARKLSSCLARQPSPHPYPDQ